jgi:integrase
MESLTKIELLNLLDHARRRRERDFLMILVAYNHGLRASEVTEMTRDAIQGDFLMIERKKKSLPTVQPLVEDENPLLSEKAPLIEYVRGMHGNQRIFKVGRKQFWRLMQRYCWQAGIIPHLSHPHILKHTCAMQIIDSAPIHVVQKYLGHKSGASTLAYLKISDADASAAVAKARKGSI